MSVFTDRVPVAEISRQARDVRFGHTVVAVITGVLFGAGWLVAKGFAVTWLAVAWSATAVRLGWQNAHGTVRPPRQELMRERDDMLAEIERLRSEIAHANGG
jgi:hypothetical protein